MNIFDQLQQAMQNLNRANAQADKSKDLEELRQAVITLNKIAVAMLHHLPQEQREKILETAKGS
jgi:radical SAM superfamily enzyme